MIYLILCLFIILLAYVETMLKGKLQSAIFGGLVAIIMVILAASRDKVGTDWTAYHEFYLYGGEGTEFGYGFLNDLFHQLGYHYNFFLLFLNLLSLTLIYFSLKRHAIFVVLGLLIFYSDLFLYFNLSGIRQAMAISFTLFSIRYIVDRKFFKFLLCVILAACFHVTSAIFIVAYFIPFVKFSKKQYLLLAVVFSLFSIFIFSVVNLFSGDLALKAKFYLELQEQDTSIKSLFLIGAIKRSLIIGLVLVFGKNMLKVKNTMYFFNVYLIGFGMYLSTYLISPDIGVRLSSYFLIFDLLLAGNLAAYNKNIYIRLTIVSIIALISLYKISTYMAIDFYEYRTIF